MNFPQHLFQELTPLQQYHHFRIWKIQDQSYWPWILILWCRIQGNRELTAS